MPRFFSLSLIVFLASDLHAQTIDPPRYFTNSLGMKFVWIRPGTFTMGSPKEEKERNAMEIQHEVKLTKGFFMGVNLVNQEQWQEVVIHRDFVKPAEGFNIGNPFRFRGDNNLPADNVSWNDCQLFLKRLREKDRQRYRLPTEAEWEYACRAGTTTPYYFGETISAAQANFAGGAAVNGKKVVNRKKTTLVGIFPPNAWGLYDMHGNLAQWCQDRYGPYPKELVIDPQGDDKRGSRVLRGGSWEDGPGRCRSACRSWDTPDNRGHGTFGFRVCFSVD